MCACGPEAYYWASVQSHPRLPWGMMMIMMAEGADPGDSWRSNSLIKSSVTSLNTVGRIEISFMLFLGAKSPFLVVQSTGYSYSVLILGFFFAAAVIVENNSLHKIQESWCRAFYLALSQISCQWTLDLQKSVRADLASMSGCLQGGGHDVQKCWERLVQPGAYSCLGNWNNPCGKVCETSTITRNIDTEIHSGFYE